MIQIDYLADHPKLISQLSPMLLEQWREMLPEDTIATREAKLRRHLNRDTLPIAWVAHVDGAACGMAALREQDLHGYQDRTPWLGGVFVAEPFRRHGLGAALCQTVETNARAMGYTTLYLFTLDKQDWYVRQGWTSDEPCTWRGHAGDIMSKKL